MRRSHLLWVAATSFACAMPDALTPDTRVTSEGTGATNALPLWPLREGYTAHAFAHEQAYARAIPLAA